MRRTYVGEMEWALDQVNVCFHDRNPEREADVRAAVQYGLEVARARRNGASMPERPVTHQARVIERRRRQREGAEAVEESRRGM